MTKKKKTTKKKRKTHVQDREKQSPPALQKENSRWSLKQPLSTVTPNLLTMNSDNKVSARDAQVILLMKQNYQEPKVLDC